MLREEYGRGGCGEEPRATGIHKPAEGIRLAEEYLRRFEVADERPNALEIDTGWHCCRWELAACRGPVNGTDNLLNTLEIWATRECKNDR